MMRTRAPLKPAWSIGSGCACGWTGCFAAWTQDLRIGVVDDQELEEPVTWSSARGEYVTRAKCE